MASSHSSADGSSCPGCGCRGPGRASAVFAPRRTARPWPLNAPVPPAESCCERSLHGFPCSRLSPYPRSVPQGGCFCIKVLSSPPHTCLVSSSQTPVNLPFVLRSDGNSEPRLVRAWPCHFGFKGARGNAGEIRHRWTKILTWAGRALAGHDFYSGSFPGF